MALPSIGDPIPGEEEFPFPHTPATTNFSTSPSDPFVVASLPDPQQQRRVYFPVFAKYVARLQEAADEELEGETVGVEGIEPTLSLVDWFERLVTDVS